MKERGVSRAAQPYGGDMSDKLLQVNNLKVSYFTEGQSLSIIRGFDLSLSKGEIVGILGESGSGKTVSMSAILRLFGDDEGSIDQGEVLFEGEDLTRLNEKRLREIRGRRIACIFQNPAEALHPYKRIGRQIEDSLKVHGIDCSKEDIIKALVEVGLGDAETVYHMFPSQLSGGQNQRVMIAQCIISRPDLLIADEPTSSIDASLRKRILDLFLYINRKYRLSVIFITHDFDIAEYLCDRLVIMYGGLSIEDGAKKDIFRAPLHPYTEELIKCARSMDSRSEVLYSLEGTPPSPREFKDQCPFYDRCRLRREECLKIPDYIEIEGRKARCLEKIVRARAGAAAAASR
jgi:oligopeptide/dipeptide ABC transporter ATP-binding protein